MEKAIKYPLTREFVERKNEATNVGESASRIKFIFIEKKSEKYFRCSRKSKTIPTLRWVSSHLWLRGASRCEVNEGENS